VSAEFLSRAGFPSHALVIRPNAPGADGPIFKGVADDATLADAIARCAQGSADGLAAIETDMRADRNPTRMRHIARLAKRLAARLTRRCPDCGTPGYGATDPAHCARCNP
jgi:predicted Zn-ribbon and HTH transcriptional regulator